MTDDEILHSRARALARPVVRDDVIADENAIDVLVVHVGRERLGIPMDRVASVARASGVVALPRASAPVYGVTAWRGRPLTVFALGAPPGEADAARLVVLGDARRAEVALIVDEVDDAVRIARDELAPATGAARRAYALGITRDALLVLDTQALIRGGTAAAVAPMTD